MSSFDKVQRRLDSALTTSNSNVYDLARDSMGDAPDFSDIVEFKQAMLRESTANWASGQLSSLTHDLSKGIIDSIN